MKKTLSISHLVTAGVLAILSLTPYAFALAQTASTTDYPETMVMPKNIPAPDSAGASIAATAQLSSRTQARITNLAANMSTRMDNVILRFEQIIDRMNVRIVVSKAQGLDTTKAEAELKNASTAVQQAKTNLATIDANVKKVVTSANMKTAWPEVRAIYVSSRDSLVSADASLHSSLTALKVALTNQYGAVSTTTASSTPPTPITQ